jgi:hypothetical protein
MHTGSCLCDEGVVEIDTSLEPIWHCHCARCRKAHASVCGRYAMDSASKFH